MLFLLKINFNLSKLLNTEQNKRRNMLLLQCVIINDVQGFKASKSPF